LDVKRVFEFFEKNGEGEGLLGESSLRRHRGPDHRAARAHERHSRRERDFAPVFGDLAEGVATGSRDSCGAGPEVFQLIEKWSVHGIFD